MPNRDAVLMIRLKRSEKDAIEEMASEGRTTASGILYQLVRLLLQNERIRRFALGSSDAE